jgi:hypothetical protein
LNDGLAFLQEGLKRCYSDVAFFLEFVIDFFRLCLFRGDPELFCVHVIEFFLILDLACQIFLVFVQIINLFIQLVDILVDKVVLLFMLQEG